METLRSLSAFFGSFAFWQQCQHNVLEPPTLQTLPLELIQDIARLLPIESAAALTMCSRGMYTALGEQYLKAGRESGSATRYKLMILLGRSRPCHIACYDCECFHRIDSANTFLPVFSLGDGCCLVRPRLCTMADHNVHLAHYYIHEKFSSSIFKMAMKLCRQRHEYSQVLQQLSLEPVTRFFDTRTERSTAVARIVGGRLLIRRQTSIILDPERMHPTPLDLPSWICPHPKPLLYRNYMATQFGFDPAACATPMRCVQCNTEYRIGVKNCENKITDITITTWKDLGSGESIHDPDYMCHIKSDFKTIRSFLPKSGALWHKFETFEQRRLYGPEWTGQLDFRTVATPEGDRKQLVQNTFFRSPGKRSILAFVI